MNNTLRGWRARSVLLGVMCLWASLAEAKIHAMVVGIDNYQSLPPLAGGVNDARDIAAALDKIKGSQVKMLLDDQANYSAVRRHWFSMLEQSMAGDTVVFSYAGHGSRVPELVPGSEADGQDDVFVLAGYADTKAGRRELIRDDQLFEWFRAAEGKGIHILFVADSCHSGTMTRAPDFRVGPRRTRQVEIDFEVGLEEDLTVEITDRPLADFKSKYVDSSRSSLPYLTFLSAGLETQQIPELSIKSLAGPEQARGALSFVLARALEGEADKNNDKVLTRGELRHYVLENVSVLTERQQTPELSPLEGPEMQVLALSARPNSSAAPPLGVDSLIYSVSLDENLKQSLTQAINGLQWSQTISAADLVLDAEKGELLSISGDLVLSGLSISDVSMMQAKLRGALEKRLAMRQLREAARPKMLSTALAPNSGSHLLGHRIQPSFSGQHGEYLIVLNLAGDGTLQLLYPLRRYDDALRHGKRSWSMTLRVAPPLGEDHMIAMAFGTPQPLLVRALEKLDGSRSSSAVLSLLREKLRNSDAEIGIVGMFSKPRVLVSSE